MQFRLGAAGNFPVVAVLFKEICLKFGVPGQEIIRGVRIPLLLPTRQDTDSTGFLYHHEFLRDNSGDILREADGSVFFDTMLSDSGDRAFQQDIAYYRTQLALRDAHSANLMVALLE